MHKCRDWQGHEGCMVKSVLQMQSTEMENQILAILKYVTCLSYSDLFHSRCVYCDTQIKICGATCGVFHSSFQISIPKKMVQIWLNLF